VIGGGTPTFVEVGDYRFAISAQYGGAEAVGEVSKKGEVFRTKEEAEESVAGIRELLADLGRWEQMINALRNIRDGVETRGYTELEPVRLEDLEFIVPSGLPTRPAPFRIVFDLARDARSRSGQLERPWLWNVKTWIAALENLKRWKSLRESIQAIGLLP